MIAKEKILETLQLQPLSDEEKQQRHVLGRLYGPIATSNTGTRNGRKYNRELWEKALADDLFKEKINTKSLFLELGHPADREETDMTKVCACIPEIPKIVDGDLYAYVDILDTPNGKLLKTFCDYGFIPGISSRGSGDIMDNDEVDPETFYLETFDIVQLPAVKDARLSMCEGLDTKALKLRKALTESYEAASEEDKKVMKETLDNLDISLEEPKEIDELKESLNGADFDKLMELAPKCFGKGLGEITIKDLEDFMKEHKITDKELIAELEKCVEEKEPVKEALSDEDIPWAEGEEPLQEDAEEESEEEEVEEEKIPEETESDEDIEEEPEDETEEIEDEEVEKSEAYTIGDLQKELDDYDKELAVEFEPLEIDGKEYQIKMLGFDDGEEGKVVISIGYDQEIGDNIDEVEGEEEIAEPEEEVIADDEEVIEEPEVDSEPAEDNGDEEVIESLKEAIRQKDLLENEIKDLKSERTVSDAEVKELKEELDKYKAAFARISDVAAKAKSLESDVNSLTEKLSQKDKEIISLKESHQVKLNEGIEKDKAQIKSLTEKLTSKQKELEDTESKLTEQANVYKKQLTERTEVAKKYKARFTETLNKYIEYRASMLGVRPAEITNRLNENFTLADIDSVCETILDDGVFMGNFQVGFDKNVKVKINESKQAKKQRDLDEEIFDDLLDLAGLK